MYLLNFNVPILFAASAGYIFITTAPLSANKFALANSLFASVRSFGWTAADEGHQIAKKNQFLKGEVNFNVLAFWLVAIPVVFEYMWIDGFKYNLEQAEEHGWDAERLTREKTLTFSYISGWAGIVALFFFLIPVARHSVLLVAMGWSPVHALRFHIWAGHLSFGLVFLHAITMLVVWFKDPLEYFHDDSTEDANFDVYFQDDGNHALYYAPYSANTGFYYVRKISITCN